MMMKRKAANIGLVIAGLCIGLSVPDYSSAAILNDFNGNGRSDLAVYQPATGHWFIRTRTGTILEWKRQWGYSSAVPVPADYDGDGITDLAVYDRNGGYWYIQSRDGRVLAWARQWGWSTGVPVPGDYDGDGKADIGIYDLETGDWFVYSIAKQQVLLWRSNWGFKGDFRWWEKPPASTVIPVPFDYDSDDIIDRAVYYRGWTMNDSGWYVKGSAGRNWFGVKNDAGEGWGSSSSIAAPGFYRSHVTSAANPFAPGVSVYKIPDGTFNTPYMHAFTLGTYRRTLPVPAHDFDGNGWHDHAVYDYLSGVWTISYNDEDGNGAPPYGAVYQQPPREYIQHGFNGAIPANIYSTIYNACGYTLAPLW